MTISILLPFSSLEKKKTTRLWFREKMPEEKKRPMYPMLYITDVILINHNSSKLKTQT